MITQVEISGYKSLCDVKLTLRPLTVFVGPNASGKSNMFDALRLLSAMVTQPDLKTAFDAHRGIPVEAFFTERGIQHSLSDQTVNVTEKRIRDLREGLTTSTPGTLLNSTCDIL